jgi:DNA primase
MTAPTAGHIPRPFIDELVASTDIIELIDQFVPLKKQGANFVACCPFHHEKSPSFNVSVKKQYYHCFGCGVGGNAISFIMEHLNQNFPEAIETLAARQGKTVPREGGQRAKQPDKSLYQLMAEVTLYYQNQLNTPQCQGLAYLQQRGIHDEMIQRYQLGFAPHDWRALSHHFKKQHQGLITTGMLVEAEGKTPYDRYRDRVMFPIHDHQGRIIAYGGRAITPENQPKYLKSPETLIFQKSRTLYGLHQIIKTNPNPPHIIIVEGYLDVIALAQHGVPEAVATLGTASSPYHIQLLNKYTKLIIFCFDGDNAGRKAAWRAMENTLPYLNDGLDARFIFLPDGHDPDTLIREEGKAAFLQRIETAKPLTQYLFDEVAAPLNLKPDAGKTQLINALAPYVLKMGDGPGRALLIQDIARLTHLDFHRITTILNQKKESKPQTTQVPLGDARIQRTPIRLAVALLLQNPEIYLRMQAEPLIIPPQHEEDMDLLRDLVNIVQTNPQSTTAGLVEHWRNTPYFEAMAKLATWAHNVPEEALFNEFLDIIAFISKQHREKIIQTLLKKSRDIGLTPEEQRELQQRVQEKNKSKIITS